MHIFKHYEPKVENEAKKVMQRKWLVIILSFVDENDSIA